MGGPGWPGLVWDDVTFKSLTNIQRHEVYY